MSEQEVFLNTVFNMKPEEVFNRGLPRSARHLKPQIHGSVPFLERNHKLRHLWILYLLAVFGSAVPFGLSRFRKVLKSQKGWRLFMEFGNPF